MKTLRIYLLPLMFVCFAWMNINTYAQENGQNNITIRDVPAFNGIKASGAFKIFLEQGSIQVVKVQAPEDIQNMIITEVKDNVLNISVSGKKLKTNGEDINVYVVCKNPESIELGGVAECIAGNNIKADNFRISLSGASKAVVNIETGTLTADFSGAADAELSGYADHLKLNMSGASDLDAKQLIVNESKIEISGAAKAFVNTSKKVKGKVSGAASLVFVNAPDVDEIEKSGMGDVAIKSKNADTATLKLGRKSKMLLITGDEDQKDTLENYKKKSKFNGHWGGVEIGVNSYFNPRNSFDFPQYYDFLDLKQQKSIALNLNVIEQSFNIIKNHFGITTGLGLTINNYRFHDNICLTGDSAKIYGFKDTSFSYIKSKLTVNYLTVPLLFEYQTNCKADKSSFHMGIGVEGGLRIGSHSKMVYKYDGKTKIKNNDDYHINPFKVDAIARIGWGKINLYGNYSLTRLFCNGEGYELYPFTVGIALVGW